MPRLSDRISVRLAPALAARLNAAARRRAKSRSAVVQQALEEHLSKETFTPFELVQDLIGCIEGPADLSTRDPFSGMKRRYRRSQQTRKS